MAHINKNLALAFMGAVLMALAGQAIAKPAHRHARAAAQAKIENSASPSEIDYGRGAQAIAASEAAAAPAAAKPSRMTRRAARRQATAQSTQNLPSSGGGDLVSEARHYLGGNPTGRGSLWCGAFMDMVLKHTGHRGGGNLARAYAHYGTRIAGPQVGAIAVMARGGGGHVGVVSGIDSSGNPIVISGNHNNKVAESVYPRGRIIAYVMPN